MKFGQKLEDENKYEKFPDEMEVHRMGVQKMEVDLFSGVEDHDVVVREVVLTKVRALLADREVAFLVGAPARKRNVKTRTTRVG
jgi:hypothetical protein